ncbi:MAG: mannonate dehydratase [Chloroflexota bacterium]|nr:mannonate dehydratase [Chloroflexota bacterium]
MKLAEYLPPFPNTTWTLARQAGCTHAVSSVPPDGPDGHGWEFLPLLRMKNRFADASLTLEVIETGFPWLHAAKLGLPGRDEEIDRCLAYVRNVGAVGIPVLCWNWMAVFNWTRTSTTTPTRGGALVTSYDHAMMDGAPPTEAGEVSEDQLWESLEYFMRAVVPAAEEAGVTLALHPDDPPISPIRGVGRILRSPEAMRRAIDLAPSPRNGITMCQGTFSTMGADVPAEIRAFGERGAIHFVHFRDVRGTPDRFLETFHDEGQTDMFAAMRVYRELGYAGPVRPDHVPTMEGEDNLAPGYNVLGRLFAIGYMKGLAEAVEKTIPAA